MLHGRRQRKLSKKGYPVGILGSDEREIRVYFMHYSNFANAKAKWEQRSRRIHWNNLFFIMTDGTGCNYDIAKEFDSLLYEHKALLTYRNLPNIKSAVRLNILKLSSEDELGTPDVCAFKSKLSIKRVIDDWDYISFLNQLSELIKKSPSRSD